MEFSPNNPIVRLCLQGMAMEDKGNPGEAGRLFLQAWNEASNDFEKFLAAYYLARQQENVCLFFCKCLQLHLNEEELLPHLHSSSLLRQMSPAFDLIALLHFRMDL